MTEKRSLSMVVPVGESVSVDGGRVVVSVKEKSGQRVRLVFTADESVQIERQLPKAVAAQSGVRMALATNSG
jgi:pyruvate kinase